jgi:hypothetical protein
VRHARVMAAIGCLLFAAVLWNCAGVVLGWYAHPHEYVVPVFGTSVGCLLYSTAYSVGWYNRQAVEQAQRRREARAAAAASVPPAAGRQDASLTARYVSDADTQVLPRVADTCLRGPNATVRRQQGGVGCLMCPHAQPPHGITAWEFIGGNTGVCPCCRQRGTLQ